MTETTTARPEPPETRFLRAARTYVDGKVTLDADIFDDMWELVAARADTGSEREAGLDVVEAERALNRLVPLLPSTARVHDDYNIIRAALGSIPERLREAPFVTLTDAIAALHRWDVSHGWAAFNAILADIDTALAVHADIVRAALAQQGTPDTRLHKVGCTIYPAAHDGFCPTPESRDE